MTKGSKQTNLSASNQSASGINDAYTFESPDTAGDALSEQNLKVSSSSKFISPASPTSSTSSDKGPAKGCEPSIARTKILTFFARHKQLRLFLNGTNSVLTGLFYVLYCLLIFICCFTNVVSALTFIIVPALCFLLLSFVRKKINSARPYEREMFDPLIKREGSGCSFPSRHSFSAFTISTCWCSMNATLGIALLCAATLLSALRVIGGVHDIKDVVCGAALGILSGALSIALSMLFQTLL